MPYLLLFQFLGAYIYSPSRIILRIIIYQREQLPLLVCKYFFIVSNDYVLSMSLDYFVSLD